MVEPHPRWEWEWDLDSLSDETHDFLTEALPEASSMGQLQIATVPFLKHLNYNPNEVFRNITYDSSDIDLTYEWFRNEQDTLEMDAVVASKPEAKPYLVVNGYRPKRSDQSAEEYYGIRGQTIGIDKSVATDYLKVANAQYSVLLSNKTIYIAWSDDANGFQDRRENVLWSDLSTLDWDRTDEMMDILGRPEDLTKHSPLGQQVELGHWPSIEKRIEAEHFELDLNEYRQKYNSVLNAETNIEKKNSLEDLAALLFNSIDCTTVRDTNLRGITNELDLVIEFSGSNDYTIFDEYGRFIIVECKNWSDSVGVPEVRDLLVTMDETRVELGILFARNGISGDNENAQRMLDDVFQRNKSIVLIIDGKDLERISNGSSFYEILDNKIYRSRFRPSS